MENKTEVKVFDKKVKIILGISALTIIMAIIVSAVVGNRETESFEMPPREEISLDEFIMHTAIKELGNANTGQQRVYAFDEVESVKRIFLNADEVITTSMTASTFTTHTIALMKALTQDEEFASMDARGISFQWMIALTDQYGNEAQDIGCIITFMKEDFGKYNWSNVSEEGVKNTAYTYWLNPAFE